MMEPRQEIRFKGLGVSEGVVIGQVLRMHDGFQHVYHWKIDVDDVESERRRFRDAVTLAREQVMSIKKQAEHRLGKDHAYIFDAHLLLLEDKKLTDDVERQIADHHANAEGAVKRAGARLLSTS